MVFEEVLHRDVAFVELTKHAVERFVWRRDRDYSKLDLQTIQGLVSNILRDGWYVVRGDKMYVYTKRYCLVCGESRGRIVVKTVLSRSQFRGGRGRRTPWRRVVVIESPSEGFVKSVVDEFCGRSLRKGRVICAPSP